LANADGEASPKTVTALLETPRIDFTPELLGRTVRFHEQETCPIKKGRTRKGTAFHILFGSFFLSKAVLLAFA
jgi:hypothetical protein